MVNQWIIWLIYSFLSKGNSHCILRCFGEMPSVTGIWSNCQITAILLAGDSLWHHTSATTLSSQGSCLCALRAFPIEDALLSFVHLLEGGGTGICAQWLGSLSRCGGEETLVVVFTDGACWRVRERCESHTIQQLTTVFCWTRMQFLWDPLVQQTVLYLHRARKSRKWLMRAKKVRYLSPQGHHLLKFRLCLQSRWRAAAGQTGASMAVL